MIVFMINQIAAIVIKYQKVELNMTTSDCLLSPNCSPEHKKIVIYYRKRTANS